MEKLPNEILNRIIGYLDKEALLSVRLLNSTWQTLAEDDLRKVVHIPLKTDKDVSELLRITSWRNENTLPPFVRFSIGKLSKGMLEELGRKYGNVIQSLRFEVDTNHNNTFEFLMKTPNINEIILRNFSNPVVMKRNCQLHLPKLRNFELFEMDTDIVKLILNSSPNIQQVKFGFPRVTDDNWRDHIIIYENIARRGIELNKLTINISSDQVNLQKLNEMAKIPFNFKVTKLKLGVDCNSFVTEEWSQVRESIEDFIHEHSSTLQVFKVHNNGWYQYTEDENPLKFNLKNLDNLEQLKLSGVKVNLGQTPKLKKLKIVSTVLNLQSTPLLKDLCIQTDNRERLPQFLDECVRLENLSLYFAEETLTTTEADDRVQLLNNFLFSHSKNLKVLKIKADNSTGLNKLQLPVMENLQKLILLNKYDEELGKIKLEQSNLPRLEFLELVDIPLDANPTLNESLETVRILKILSESLLYFKNTILRFPMIKKLHIQGIDPGFLPFVFENLTHLEELKIEVVRIEDPNCNVTWDELTGNSEVVDFVGELSNRNLNTSIPNLGDLTDLKRLSITTTHECMDDEVKAISYLISCGKLKNLRYFELMPKGRYVRDLKQHQLEKELILNFYPFVKIIVSNNTRIFITPS